MNLLENFPPRYVERIKQLIPADQWDLFFQNVTKPMPRTIRASQDIINKTPKTWHLKSVSEIPEAFFIDREDQKTLPLGKTLEHFSGEIYVQSLSSMLPVKILDPQPGEKILDICAAPGSKSTFLAQKMENKGLLVCNEPSGSRSKKLSANLNRMGVLNSVMIQSDGTILHNFFGQEFDKILLDAPCSSEGFSRKDAQFFSKMWSETKIFEAAKLQKRLIESCFKMLVPGGTLLYSTCTSAPEENEFIVEHLLKEFPQAKLLPIDLGEIPAQKGISEFEGRPISPNVAENVRRIYPHLETENWSSESFFVCLIEKTEPLKMAPPQKPLIKNPPNIYKKNHTAEIITKLAKSFGIDKKIFHKQVITEKEGELFISSKDASQFCQKNLFRRFGLKIVDKHGHITGDFAHTFGKYATKNILHFNKTQKDRFLAGYDFLLKDFELSEVFPHKTEVICLHKNTCLGWGKVVQEKLKNKLSKDLIIK